METNEYRILVVNGKHILQQWDNCIDHEWFNKGIFSTNEEAIAHLLEIDNKVKQVEIKYVITHIETIRQ